MFRVQRGLSLVGVGIGPVFATIPYESPIDPTRAFPRLTAVRLGSAGRDANMTGILGNDDFGGWLNFTLANSFRVNREMTAEQIPHRYYWEVIESDPDPAAGFRVVHSDSETLIPGQAVSTLAAAPGISDLSRNVLLITASSSSRTAQRWPSVTVEARLGPGGERMFERQDANGTTIVSYVQLEMGSEWSVRQSHAIHAMPGIGMLYDDAGLAPWSEKLILASYSAPALANRQASNLIVRPSLPDPGQFILTLPPNAQAGTYRSTAFVLHHPLLAVSHQYKPDFGGLGSFDDELAVSPAYAMPPARSSLIVQATNTEDALNYFRQGWGYTLDAQAGTFRRCRADSSDPTLLYAQFVRWPGPVSGKQEACALEAPCLAK